MPCGEVAVRRSSSTERRSTSRSPIGAEATNHTCHWSRATWQKTLPSLFWCDPGYSSIAGCLLLPGVPRDASRIAWGIPLPSPSRPFPFLLFLPPLPSLHPLSPSPHPQDPQECVCSFPVLSCFSCLAAVFLLRCLFCFALFALCAFSPCPLPLFLSFVLPASCVLPGLFFAFVVFLCFPVVVVGGGGGWLSLCVCACPELRKIRPILAGVLALGLATSSASRFSGISDQR